MIKITSQNSNHQCDSIGRTITTWDSKKCCWIVNPEFENEQIEWYGEDNDFPAGCTLTEFILNNPNWDKMPDISVTWYWNTKETCIAAFGWPDSFGQSPDFWDKQVYPYTCNRSWGYIDESLDTTVERFGKYCKFHTHADRVVVSYNSEILFDGKLL